MKNITNIVILDAEEKLTPLDDEKSTTVESNTTTDVKMRIKMKGTPPSEVESGVAKNTFFHFMK